MAKRADNHARRRPRQARARVTVDTILEAAAQILARQGYAALTTNRIAERAGVSIGSLYQYFPNKEAVLVALFERYLESMFSAAERAARERQGAPLPEVLRAVIEELLAVRIAAAGLHRKLMEEGPRLGRLRRIRAIKAKSVRLIRQLLEQYRSLTARTDLDRSAYVLVNAIESLMHAMLIDTPTPPRAVMVDEITLVALGYLTYRDDASGRRIRRGRSTSR